MQERERKPGERPQTGGDVRGPTRGDLSAEFKTGFTDWDNPEDEIEDAPEGYYDEQGDEEYELGPDDPDYDLSEAAGYSRWEGHGRRSLVPYWVIVALCLLFIFAMLVPVLLRLT
jgi:hypothetical protein